MSMRWVFEALSPAGARGRLSIFIFHRVRPEIDPLFPGDPDVERFTAQMGWVARWFNVLPLLEAAERLRDGTLPARAAAITFDDGYADNYTIALPILQKFGLTATVFVATGFLDGGRMWNDTVIEGIRHARVSRIRTEDLGLGELSIETVEAKRHAIATILPKLKYLDPAEREARATRLAATLNAKLPDDLMMTCEQLHALHAAGISIGAHTVSHPILASISDAAAREEISRSKARLQAILQEDIGLFAYPNGKPGTDYSLPHVAQVRDVGFKAAVSTSPGAATANSDLHQLPRFTPWDRSAWRYALRLADNLRSAAPHSLGQAA